MRPGPHSPLPRLPHAFRRPLACFLVLLTGIAASSCNSLTDSRDKGSLLISIQNEEIGGPGRFRVQRPGVNILVTSNVEAKNIPVGQYTVTAEPITDDIRTWEAIPQSFPITIASGQQSSAVVAYRLRPGSLRVVVTGIPQGGVGDIVLNGPSGERYRVTNTKTLDSLPPGTWQLEALPSLTMGHTYAPRFSLSTVSLASGGNTVLGVDYRIATGALAFNYRGLPTGVRGEVTIDGPDGQLITHEPVVTNLTPGPYTITTRTTHAANGLPFTPEQSTLQADVTADINPASLSIDYEATANDLVVEGAYLVQATQRLDGSVPLVAGRDALLRVFVTNSRTNQLTPTVRARIYDGASLVHTALVEPGEPSVRMHTAEGIMSSTWNLVVPGHMIRPALGIIVDVDPSDTIDEFDRSNNTWPRFRDPQPIAVNDVPPFRVTVVPVATGSRTGNATEANRMEYLATLRRLFPVNAVDVRLRPPFTSARSTLGPNDREGWSVVIGELTMLRAAEGAAANEHYFGVVNVNYTIGVQGMGVLGGYIAMGWDHANKSDVAAHEWGHNFGLGHAPCGVNEALEANYPYPDGNIGVFGWNQESNTLMFPTSKDIMGYCNNMWISDYVWMLSMTNRHNAAAGASVVAARQPIDGLLVWGRIVNGKPVLEPAFRVTAPATPLTARGTHRLQALDGKGSVLAEFPVQPQQLDHHDAAAFAVVVPWNAQLEQELATLRVRDVRVPLAAAEVTSRAAQLAARQQLPIAAPVDPAAAVRAVGARRLRMEWNSSEYPVALVREADSGRIVALLREHAREFIGSGQADFSVTFSDGVRSVTRRLGQ